MAKIIFKYKKSDGSLSDREILNASFLKESSNYLNDFKKPGVKYITGIELDKTGLTDEEIEKYENAIAEYHAIAKVTLEEFLGAANLDAKKVQPKTFKKEGVIGDPKVI